MIDEANEVACDAIPTYRNEVKPKRVRCAQLRIDISDDLRKAVKVHCAKQEETICSFVTEAIREHLNRANARK